MTWLSAVLSGVDELADALEALRSLPEGSLSGEAEGALSSVWGAVERLVDSLPEEVDLGSAEGLGEAEEAAESLVEALIRLSAAVEMEGLDRLPEDVREAHRRVSSFLRRVRAARQVQYPVGFSSLTPRLPRVRRRELTERLLGRRS